MPEHALLTIEDHRALRVSTERGIGLGDAVMCAIAVPSEFRRVQDEYPILFRLNAERDRFTALAMFGFETGENLFLDDGKWDARYLPLAIDIQPFLIGGSPSESGDKQVHIDLASPRIDGNGAGDGVRLFDEDGRPTPYLESITDKLGELDLGYRESEAFFAALDRYKLLEPLTLEIKLDDGSTNRLVGFHGIDEDRLRELDAATLGKLHADDHLMPIFMALASLGRLRELIARKNRRIGHG
jgi:hypothetical protein